MKQKRILIVEDKLPNVMTLCRALLHPMAGEYQVEVCPLADIALKRLKYEEFDLIVTDLRMPGTSGLDLIRHVRQTRPQTHTMLITAFGSPELENETRRLGAAFLSKPFSLHEFIATVQGILNEETQNRGAEQLAIEKELEADRAHWPW
jgi:two-component system response regulator PilR (NtrC family)